MHVHNPEQLHCSHPACGERAVGYPFQQELVPLCGVHIMEHRRQGHDVRFVDGGVCGDCDGRGGECPRCEGSGYIGEAVLDEGRRRAADREQGRAREEGRRRAEEASARLARDEEARRQLAEREEAQREENRRRTARLTEEANAAVEAGQQAADARAEQARRESEERKRAEEEARQRAEQAQRESEARRRAEEEARQRAEQAQRESEERKHVEEEVRQSCLTCDGRGQVFIYAATPSRENRGGRWITCPDCGGLGHRRAPPTRSGNGKNSDGGSSCGHGWCWFVLVLLLIAAIGGGYYWYMQRGLPVEFESLPTPTPSTESVQEGTPTPTPAPVPAAPTSTPYPCADPTPTLGAPSATPTPLGPSAPGATSTPAWEAPEPLSDEWRERANSWSREQVDAALTESLAVFDAGLDDLDSMQPVDACRRVTVFEVHLETAEYLVDAHRLDREPVPGQGAAALSWMIWLRHQRGLFTEAVRNHAPVAECRRLLAPPTPTPTPEPPTATPTLGPPTSTPLPPCPTATPTPPPTATPTATATPRPTPTATPTLRQRPNATSTPLVGKQRLSASEVQELRLLALELVNKDRAGHGLRPVTLGSNPAAQLHAEDMLEHNYSGHWWVDGRDPTQVYSETGGTSYAQENTADWGCVSLTNCRLAPPRDAIVRLQQSLMGSPGHRRNILDPAHQTLNVGIAYDGKRYTLAQLFGGGAAEADDGPSLSSGGAFALSLSKRESGVRVHRTIDVYYTPPNAPLTASQIEFLNSGACIGGVGFIETCGERLAGIIPPAPAGSSYSNLGAIYVEADRWDENTSSFRFTASLGNRATKPGVYTVVVFRDNSDLLTKLSVTQPAR